MSCCQNNKQKEINNESQIAESAKRNSATQVDPEAANTCAQTENVVSIETTESQTDFYSILGVDEDASYDTIKRKWLKLSLIYHPDKCEGNDEMFRKINLAYKVLSNPENRKKYNDSLAKTYDQLRETGSRDTEYHVNQDFLKSDETRDNAAVFDREKFLNAFENSRGKFEELNEIQVVNEKEAREMPQKNIDQIRAERDAELFQFRQEQKTDLFDPRHNKEEFNYVFDQFRKMTRTDLEESNISGSASRVKPESELDYAPVDFDYMHPSATSELVANLTSKYQSQFRDGDIPIVTSQTKIPQSQLEAMMEQRDQETHEISEKFKEKAEFTIDDSDKLIMESELLKSDLEVDSN